MIKTLFVSSALGWDQTGHEAIGMTAMSALQGKALFQTKKLLAGKDAVDVSGWAHKVDREYPWAPDMHFQKPSGSMDDCNSLQVTESCNDDSRKGLCLIPVIQYFYGHVNDTQINSAPITLPEGVHFTDADAVKFIINLLGDMHQPFHVLFREESEKRMVTFNGKPMSLFDFWDKNIAEYVKDTQPGFWQGGWTRVDAVKREYKEETQAWKNLGIRAPNELLPKWATENARLACKFVKALPAQKGDAPTPIPTQLLREWIKDMEKNILIAGARTTIVLNSLLHNSIKHEVERGSGVKVKEDKPLDFEDDETNTFSKPRKIGENWAANLATNFILLIIVVILFYFLIVRPTQPQRCGTSGKYV